MIPIVAATAWQAKGEAGFAQAPVGTGPYRAVDWGSKSGSAKFQAADSWRRPVSMTALELIPLDAPFGRLQALLSGRVDVAERINAEDISQAESAGFRVASLPAPQVVSLTFRVADNPNSPIADVRVRQALALAVNRDAMAKQILLGTVVPASQATNAQTIGYNPDIHVPPYDPDRAKALLAVAGYPNGFAFNADVVVGTSPADDLLYQQTVADLRKVGVTVTLRTLPYAVWLRKYTAGDWGNADAFSFVWDSSSFYDVVRVLSLASCYKAPPFFCDPTLTPIFDAVGSELTEQRRLPALRDLSARMVDLAPALWLVTVTYHYGLSPRLTNVGLRNSGLIYETITAHP
jgi:peptide/nickel transport system substrate-binding protein